MNKTAYWHDAHTKLSLQFQELERRNYILEDAVVAIAELIDASADPDNLGPDQKLILALATYIREKQ